MDKNDVTTGAKGIAAAMEGPFGRRKFQAVVLEHIDYFARARASGALWTQIAEALVRAGVRSPQGKPYRANVLRAMVSRAGRSNEGSLAPPKSSAEPKRSAGKNPQIALRAPSPPASKSKPMSAELSPKPSQASDRLNEVRSRIARASRLRGLRKTDR